MVCKTCGRTVRGRPSADGTCRQCRGLPPMKARKPKGYTAAMPQPSANTEADKSSDGAEDDAPEDAE